MSVKRRVYSAQIRHGILNWREVVSVLSLLFITSHKSATAFEKGSKINWAYTLPIFKIPKDNRSPLTVVI